MTLNELLSQPELENKLLNAEQTLGFVTAMAAAPHVLDPSEWLPYLWGGEETAPFESAEQFEQYAGLIVNEWNQTHAALLEGTWAWPEGYDLDEEEVVTESVRDFAEGLLQGWQLSRDDWETLMPEDSEDNALLGGVLLSVSMLYDPETAIMTLSEQGLTGLDEFAEIYNAMPVMLCGLSQRGNQLAQSSKH
ncbi:UPF0149 family protein [Vibrio gangliei]|uniref:UPF0149 family protein n=1 Tax=Vibrio gangliei TaxID=2077090 RepID=UPI000D01A636|nr:UPF0149 family protein [Vibrio gangliei]